MAFRLAIVAVAGAVFAASMTPAAAERVLERLPGTDIPGFDYRTLRNVPLADCERVCLADTDCAAFTYNERAQWCFLKSEVGPRTPYRGATSAVVRESAPDSTLPMPDISYLPAAFAQEAQALSARVSAINRTGVARDGLAVAAASILSRGTSQDWLNFARTTLDQRARRFGERILLQRTAGAAAYLALENASTVAEQGEALAVISDVLERQSLFRPAIFASEASVALRFDTQESERLERLRSQFGFRVLDYTVNAELDAPRMCVQFSEPLSGDAASLQRFVTLDGASDPAISVESRQLCVEGLAHGERFEVGLREGLPSTVGERLSQPASFRVYVRDRAPSARFDANDYVLPSNAPGVPVATMNTARLELSLMRVGDRNLAETVRRGDFKRQLWPWEVSSLAAERGATVWSGHMAVETRRNATVRTLVP
ncbi:MAG: PAN domain-containing protein, partial [Pseudomonadota bacterium]